MARGSSDVEYSAAGGEGLGMRDFCLYVWLRRAAVLAAHIISLGLVILTSILSRPGTSLFSWHPVCMSLGFCLCMTEGILLFSAEGSPFCFKSRKWKVRLHWFLQALLLVCGATGFGFMVASKNIKEHPHFTSWHSLLGVATMAATMLQAICGVFLLFPKLISTRSFPRLRLYHATCGLVAYLLASVTVMSAMFTDWFQASVTGTVWYIFLLLPLFPALVVMNQITSAFLPKKKITS
ncbi:cytochrome b561 domain-containing protein 1-like [Sinocyclocheilus anshuiensis]|uniref:ascorbate ferrireductase (transmembrane) n=1 Tax=Sinocyclocheilus anshuiensis TaxID=1608454 RepID=A0A671T8F9_9TELE|nr:PREDICTED: cytochrome b561 domain-containing protein 1-like [Sinocyclocheilus anshuiensis]